MAAQSLRRSDANGDNLQGMCASLIGKLLSCGVATNVVKTVVGNLEDLVDEVHTSIADDVLNLLPENEKLKVQMEDYFGNLENPLSDINTETKWNTFFGEKCRLVDPTEIALGVRYDTRKNKTSGTYGHVSLTDKFVYVPLLETLKFIFSNKDIYSHFVQSSGISGLYTDFCDGNYFKDHQLFSKVKNALQIQLFFDEFETANPLGSKHGLHKVGNIYFVLRNFSPKINSSLMNIHLVAPFHS